MKMDSPTSSVRGWETLNSLRENKITILTTLTLKHFNHNI